MNEENPHRLGSLNELRDFHVVSNDLYDQIESCIRSARNLLSPHAPAARALLTVKQLWIKR